MREVDLSLHGAIQTPDGDNPAHLRVLLERSETAPDAPTLVVLELEADDPLPPALAGALGTFDTMPTSPMRLTLVEATELACALASVVTEACGLRGQQQ